MARTAAKTEKVVDVTLPRGPAPDDGNTSAGAGAKAVPPPPAFTIFGLEPTPEVFAIFLVYFVQGILGLSRLAVSYYFKDELHLDPGDLAIYTGLSAIPWLIKPIYGFVSDTYPLFGYRRRSYLVLCGVAGAASWAALCFGKPGLAVSSALLLLGSAGTACSDVVVDSIVVEASRDAPASKAGSFQSLCWGSAAIGGIVSAYFSGSLIEHYGTSFVFGVTALFPLLVVAAAMLINESRVSKGQLPGSSGGSRTPSSLQAQGERGIEQVKTLWNAVKQPSILYPAIFVFAWQATPSADSALFFFYNDQLHFGPEFLGRVRLVGNVASLAGIYLYNTYFKYIELKTMFRWAAIVGTALSLTQVILVTGVNEQLGISNEWFVIADEIVLTVLGKISFMPVLVLASRLCPEGVEATLFATLMSILNGGSVTGSFVGSMVTKGLGVSSDDFSNLPALVTICALGTLLPLPLLRFVPSISETREEDEPEAESKNV